MTSTGKLIALIPARSGSKRVPGKNIRKLAGHPLLAYTIQVAKDSGLFGEHIYVSSDSDEYLEIAERHGARGIRRLRKDAIDSSPDGDWIKHAWMLVGDNAEGVFILRPTSPFRTFKMLIRALDKFRCHTPGQLKAIECAKQHPFKMWNLDYAFMSPYVGTSEHLLPSCNLPDVFVQNASLEIRRQWDSPGGEGCIWHPIAPFIPFITEGYEGFDINTEDDWILAEALIERGLATLPEIKL